MRYDSGVRGWEASDKFRFSDLPGRVWESITNQEGPYTLLITTIMELGPQSHYGDGLLGPNSIIVVYMDPLGKCRFTLKGADRSQPGQGRWGEIPKSQSYSRPVTPNPTK